MADGDVILNGVTYNPADFTANGGYGYVDIFPDPIFADMLEEIRIQIGTYNEKLVASSTTSTAIGTGSKTITVEADKAFFPGAFVAVWYNAANFMIGTVTSYNSTTGELVFNSSDTYDTGSGTYANWIVSFHLPPPSDLGTNFAISPTVPDPGASDDSTKVPNTAWVRDLFGAAGVATASKGVILGADKNLDTLVLADGGLKLGAGAGTAVTASAAELNLLDTSVAGTAVASKALVLGADKNIDTIAIAASGLKIGSGAGTAVTATAAQLNYTAVTTPGTAEASKALILGASKNIDTISVTKDGFQIGGAAVTCTAAELNLLDGITTLSGVNTGDEPDANTTTKGIVELATDAEVAAGADTTRVITPAGLFSTLAKSHGANGYQKFPNGLIVQWGSGSTGDVDITFPIAFSALYNIQVTNQYSSGAATEMAVSLHTWSTTGFNYHTPTSTGVFWMAIGI